MSADDNDSLVGKVQEKVGWLTGDREAEAKGKLARLDDGSGDESDDDAAEAVAQAEKDLRQDYEEYDPAVDDDPTAPDVTPADIDPRPGT